MIVTIDDVNATIIVLAVVACLVAAGCWLMVDPTMRLLRVMRLTVTFWLDRGLGYDLPRAFRAARRHA